MSDDELDDEDRAILQQMKELADQLLVPGLSASEIEALSGRIDALGRKIKPKAWEFDAFALLLMARQGTFLQDFSAFYRDRDELDRHLLGGEPNDPRP